MSVKLFTTYQPDEEEFVAMVDSDGTEHKFRLNPSLPGRLILNFMHVSGTENSDELADAINAVLDNAIVEEDREAWNEFIDAPKNGVTIGVLSEVVGYVTSVLSGNDQAPEA